ncbi:hypothetical protein NMY22_g9460 [Coprinellus aureogranulatus]|nr:hypothetical protein NMY22_g9460 [Coprinellus aureogranulatus]
MAPSGFKSRFSLLSSQVVDGGIDERNSAAFSERTDARGTLRERCPLPAAPQLTSPPRHSSQCNEINVSHMPSALNMTNDLPENADAMPQPEREGEEGEAQHAQKKSSASGSQTTKLLREFQDAVPELLSMMIEAENPVRFVDLECSCKCKRKRTVMCFDCIASRPVCEVCFVADHSHNPFHWASVWDSEAGHFTKRELSSLIPDYVYNIGHSARSCPSASVDNLAKPINLTVVDTNGIHKTQVRFCVCSGFVNRVDQLMASCLFPATLRQPKTVFTFNVLDQFSLHHLESRAAAQNYVRALYRLTSNSFPDDVSEIYDQFIVATQVWQFLLAKKRLGHAHGIQKVLTHRTAGTLIWRKLVDHCLRHLSQLQRTLDGNHHANHYMKNTDPESFSLYGGEAQFPSEEEYHAFIGALLTTSAQKSTCSYLNAVNKQDRKKFKHMDITGVVNCQCSHVFVLSTVDLQLGEKFWNADYALAHMIRQCMVLDDEDIYNIAADFLLSYDISCAYWVNLVDRFTEKFPDLVPVVERIRCLIPLVHVQNHKDNCMYEYACSYTPNAGHFHGEMAEQYWVVSNPFGPQARQMNNGLRQDTLINLANFWNWIKTQRMGGRLKKDITTAWDLFIFHKENFDELTRLNGVKRIKKWQAEPRGKKTYRDGEIECVYRQKQVKVPSQKKVYETMLEVLEKADEAAAKEKYGSTIKPKAKGKKVAEADQAQASADSLEGDSIVMLNEAVEIQDLQLKVQSLQKRSEKYNTDDIKKSVIDQERILSKRLDTFRSRQKNLRLHTAVADSVAEQSIRRVPLCRERLFIPSDFTRPQQRKYGLTELAQTERKLREGAAFDKIQKVQELSKALSLDTQAKNDGRGQRENTRNAKIIANTRVAMNLAIESYNKNRTALLALGYGDHRLPALTLEDTKRKPTAVKRQTGDSRRADGVSSVLAKVASGTKTKVSSSKRKSSGTETDGCASDIPSSKRSRTTDAKAKTGPGELAEPFKEGWIWDLSCVGLTAKEMKAWSEEADRVQWYRAEAEMARWREEWETRQADLVRTVRSFERMSKVWAELATQPSLSGAYMSYARKQATMYKRMKEDAVEHLQEAIGRGMFWDDDEFVRYIQERRQEDSFPPPGMIREDELHSRYE